MKPISIKQLADVNFMDIRCSTYATLLMFASAILLAIAFATPAWLVSETMQNQRFSKLGLWEVCFVKLNDKHYRYDRVISGCNWILDEDNSFLRSFLEPSKYSIYIYQSFNLFRV